MAEGFFQRLESRIREVDSLLCVGLDPRVPPHDTTDPRRAIVEQNARIIDATSAYAACYKPNVAFYEEHGPKGLAALRETLARIPSDIPVILDAKRGDIGATSEAYARAVFRGHGVDAVTVAPYMGRDSVVPFLEYPERGVFVLCRTSNPGSRDLQDLSVDTPEGQVPLYRYLATVCEAWGPNVGLVVAGNDETALRVVRRLLPDVWLLAPGIGAQGGDVAAAVEAGARGDGAGIIPVVSRAIAGAEDPGRRARELRDQINAGRRKATAGDRASIGGGGMRERLLRRLIEQDCFRVGSFRLKSGAVSPFYVDLRRIVSDPGLLRLTGRAYATLLRDLPFHRIAAVPVAAVPLATAVSLELGVPMVYPRMPAKPHGTGNTVEGAYSEGERVVLLDDLITTGASKIEAVRILREQGLVVTDLVVLLERGAGGRQELSEHGVQVHAYAGITELFAVCRSLGIADDRQLQEMERFARDG